MQKGIFKLNSKAFIAVQCFKFLTKWSVCKTWINNTCSFRKSKNTFKSEQRDGYKCRSCSQYENLFSCPKLNMANSNMCDNKLQVLCRDRVNVGFNTNLVLKYYNRAWLTSKHWTKNKKKILTYFGKSHEKLGIVSKVCVV